MLVCVLCVLFFFFFKQKTAYEMRISDWSSDVCSSDLERRQQHRDDTARRRHEAGPGGVVTEPGLHPQRLQHDRAEEHRITEAEHQRANREVAVLEQRQIDDRMLFAELPDQEHDEDRKSTRLNSSH